MGLREGELLSHFVLRSYSRKAAIQSKNLKIQNRKIKKLRELYRRLEWDSEPRWMD